MHPFQLAMFYDSKQAVLLQLFLLSYGKNEMPPPAYCASVTLIQEKIISPCKAFQKRVCLKDKILICVKVSNPSRQELLCSLTSLAAVTGKQWKYQHISLNCSFGETERSRFSIFH